MLRGTDAPLGFVFGCLTLREFVVVMGKSQVDASAVNVEGKRQH